MERRSSRWFLTEENLRNAEPFISVRFLQFARHFLSGIANRWRGLDRFSFFEECFVMRQIILLTAALLVCAACGFYFLRHAPDGPVVDNQAWADDASAARNSLLDKVDHSTWHRLLKRYVDDDGMVNYQAWEESPEDRAALKRYLGALSRADAQTPASKQGKLAFWINAYNALTVHGILEVYPTTSIRKHTAVAFGYNIWKDLLLPVGEEKYSLNDIEHEVLRKLNEPRIHFAIVCASIGCPRLRNGAYSPDTLEAQLADNTRDFFSRSRNLRIDHQRQIIYVSSILDWFSEDFGTTPQEGLARLSKYMPDKAARFVQQGRFSVRYLHYDWSLNEQ